MATRSNGGKPPPKSKAELLAEARALAAELKAAEQAADESAAQFKKDDLARTRAAWKFGDWLKTNAPNVGPGRPTKAAARNVLILAEVAGDTGYSAVRLKVIRRTAEFWPPANRRLDMSFKEHTTAMEQSHNDLQAAVKLLGKAEKRRAESAPRRTQATVSIGDYIKRTAPAQLRANLATDLLEDDDVQEELAKSPERGGKVAAKLLAKNKKKAEVVADLLEKESVVKAVNKVIAKRNKPKVAAALAKQKAEQEAALEATYSERDKAVLGRNGDRAQAEALAQEATRQDAPNEDRVYVSPEGDVYNHDYDKENPDKPFIETHSGSKVNWHDPMFCETVLPGEVIDSIESNIKWITGPMYTLGRKDKQRLNAVLTEGLEANK
jgi:hypothetical protein